MSRCIATTKDGARCKKMATTDSMYCAIHSKTSTDPPEQPSSGIVSMLMSAIGWTSVNEGGILSLYQVIKPLGDGAYGTVYLAKQKKTGNEVAIKKMSIDRRDIAEKEFAISKSIGCSDHILCYKDLIVDQQYVYLIMDYLPGKDLYDIIASTKDRFSTSELIIMFKQLLLGLHALHSKNIVHMDLKSENIRSTIGGLVIIDMGMTCSLLKEPICNLKDSPGTRETWSPEIGYAFTQPSPHMSSQEFLASDIWMLGLCFKNIAELHVKDMANIYPQSSREKYLREWATINKIEPANTSCKPLNTLMNDMLKIDYTQRPNSKNLLSRINTIKC